MHSYFNRKSDLKNTEFQTFYLLILKIKDFILPLLYNKFFSFFSKTTYGRFYRPKKNAQYQAPWSERAARRYKIINNLVIVSLNSKTKLNSVITATNCTVIHRKYMVITINFLNIMLVNIAPCYIF